ncbi:MAG: hypothetical protein RIB03_02310 [Henriciella sp.]|uniref:hypothetical protein n=1 Tax=Henriciella sp. TaxID=1968823 RepID=UPI0032EDC6FA
MRVSTRNILAAGAGLAALATVAGAAFAGGGSGCNTCNTPPPPPSYTSKDNSGCCNRGKSHGVIVPGVNIAGPNISITGTNVNVGGGRLNFSGETYLNVAAGASASSEVFAYAGGGGGFSGPAPVATTSIQGLNVVGGGETYTETVTEEVPTIEEYCVDEISYHTVYEAVQAVCLDDSGSPHPASQVQPGQSVAGDYRGELFRCMAGTRMQVTLGQVENGEPNFDHGQTMACAKGEALVHGAAGNLVCKPQTPQRNCNERSLLRRYGPGIKVIRTKAAKKVCIPQQRTVMTSVTREVERVKESKSKPMVFDGGVGQGVY